MMMRYKSLFLCFLLLPFLSSAGFALPFDVKHILDNFVCNAMCLIEYVIAMVAAAAIIIAAIRHMSSTDPEIKTDTRVWMLCALLALTIILVVIPFANLMTRDIGIFQTFNCDCIPIDFGDTLEDAFCNLACILIDFSVGLATLVVIYSGFRYLSSSGDPAVRHRAVLHIKAALVALLIVLLVAPLINELTNDSIPLLNCDCLPDLSFERTVTESFCALICLVEYITTTVAALVIFVGGIKYITSEDSEGRKSAIKYLIGALTGILIIWLAIPIVNQVTDGVIPGMNCGCDSVFEAAEKINEAFCGLICLIKFIAVGVASLAIVFSGFKYLTSGDDPRVRQMALKWMAGAFVGLFIIIAGIPLINEITQDRLPGISCDCSTRMEFVDDINEIFCGLICMIQYVAVGVAIIVISVGGLMYLVSGEDHNRRIFAVRWIVTGLVGLILVFIAVPLVNHATDGILPGFSCGCLPDLGVREFINETACGLICLVIEIIAAVAALVIVVAGLKYLASGDDPVARRRALDVIVAAFLGLVLVIIAVPVINLVLFGPMEKIHCWCLPDISAEQAISDAFCALICLVEYLAGAIAALVIVAAGFKYLTAVADHERRSAIRWIIAALVGLVIIAVAIPVVNIVTNGILPGVNCECVTYTGRSLVADARVGLVPNPEGTDAACGVGEKVYFDASRSYCRDGNIVYWGWDFGYGDVIEGETVIQEYTRPLSLRSVLLTVKDDKGRVAKDVVTVEVSWSSDASAGIRGYGTPRVSGTSSGESDEDAVDGMDYILTVEVSETNF